MRTVVVGGAGHVGLGLCLTLTEAGHSVVGVDRDAAANQLIMSGTLPFLEEGGSEALGRALAAERLEMTCVYEAVVGSDVVVIVPGTPVDENLNPRLDTLEDVIHAVAPYLHAGQLILLRSTISPGTTSSVRSILEQSTELSVGRDLLLAYAPERVVQGKSLAELPVLPQIIGAFDEPSYAAAEAFFATYLRAECIRLDPVEAELGKLITNMARYVEFAFANEVYLLADLWGADATRLIEGINRGYPRLRIARPGPNVGGPCLYKDGHFLVERVPFPELISTAFKINEGMPAQIAMKLQQVEGVKRVGVLGMTFKAGSDDTRNSLSFKLKKQLERERYEVVCVDPYVPQYADDAGLRGADALVLMTPHPEFTDLAEISARVANEECIVIDIWGHWAERTPTARNGVFRLGEARL